MAKSFLLQKKAKGSGWNICDPNGGVSGEGKTRDGLNKVLEMSKAKTTSMRLAAWNVTIRDDKNQTRTERVNAQTYKGAEKAVQPRLQKGETIQSMTVAKGAASPAFSGTQPCCGAFVPKHKEDCKAYNDNFTKTIQQLKALPSRQSSEDLKEKDTDTGDYDFYKSDPGSSAGEEEWIAMKEMGIIGSNNIADENEDNPACICGHRFYDHNQPGYCDYCDPESDTKGPKGCGGFTPLNGPLETPHLGAADDMCEACGRDVANRECSHGILCDTCDEQVHGAVGGPCDFDDPIIYKKDFVVPDSALGRRRRATGPTRMEKLRARTTLPETEQEQHNWIIKGSTVVCSQCGTPFNMDISSAECSKRAHVAATKPEDEGAILQQKCPLCGHVPVYREAKKSEAPHKYYCHACNRGFDEFKAATAAKPRTPVKYPDSQAGAIQYLRDDSQGLSLDGATARPDPSVQGVWEVRMKNGDRAIVYLAGYKEPMGNVRAANDFEVETQDDRDFNEQERKSRPDPYGVRGSAAAPALAQHYHGFRSGDTCACGAKRCSSVSESTKLRCTKAAEENGLCKGHQFRAMEMNASKKAWQAPPPPKPPAHVQKAPNNIKRPAPPAGSPQVGYPGQNSFIGIEPTDSPVTDNTMTPAQRQQMDQQEKERREKLTPEQQKQEFQEKMEQMRQQDDTIPARQMNVASNRLTARFLRKKADWTKPHCESCGRSMVGQDLRATEGYTPCCNELVCSGINPSQPFFRGYRFGNEKTNVRACCWAQAEEIFAKKGIKIPADASRLD